ncbi:trypsin-like serine peptidase [Methylocella sp.]|uniref:trypsin-like serine peptidase n=1 Tax=Methylocella sp. TaxID=1978226 RepID=UPI0037839A1B
MSVFYAHLRTGAAAVVAASALAGAAQAQTVATPDVVAAAVASSGGIDFANAKPMPMPTVSKEFAASAAGFAAAAAVGAPGFERGGGGNGDLAPVRLAPALDLTSKAASKAGVSPQEFGTNNHPYTTARVNAVGNVTANYYPFRAAGKLFFKIGSSSYVCSAALIKPGLLATAAHCVSNFGKSQFYTGFTFVPAYSNGAAPYGSYTGRQARVLTSYYKGTDSCATKGVVCQNDVAVIALNPVSNVYPGTRTGWFGYGWNGYGFTNSGIALITQLGYPVALDSGALMERTDSQGVRTSSASNNTVIGSLQTGGSSGGPWVVNLGVAPVLNGTSFGSEGNNNVIVGSTSWGYTSTLPKEQGASAYTTTNIVALVNAQCAATPQVCSTSKK